MGSLLLLFFDITNLIRIAEDLNVIVSSHAQFHDKHFLYLGDEPWRGPFNRNFFLFFI